MHLGSVLVGIMVGIVLGLLIGRLARRPRREEAPDDFSPAGGETKWPVSDAQAPEPVLANEPVLVWQPPRDQIDEVRAAPEIARDEVPEEAPANGRQPLLEELLAANRRLMDEAQTRLSRESGDAPAEPRPEQGSGYVRPAPVSSGEDLLARSRRLTEDAKQRLAREQNPESG